MNEKLAKNLDNILENNLENVLDSISPEEVIDAQVTPVVVVHILIQGIRLKPVLAPPPLRLKPSVATINDVPLRHVATMMMCHWDNKHHDNHVPVSHRRVLFASSVT